MIDAELDNLGMRPVRRENLTLAHHETTPKQIKAIVFEIQEMINNIKTRIKKGKYDFKNLVLAH